MEMTPGDDFERRLSSSVSSLLRKHLEDGHSGDKAVEMVLDLPCEELRELVRPLVVDQLKQIERAQTLAAERVSAEIIRRQEEARAAHPAGSGSARAGRTTRGDGPSRTSVARAPSPYTELAARWRHLAAKSIDIPRQPRVLWFEATVAQLTVRAEFMEQLSSANKATADLIRQAIADINAAGVGNLGELIALDRQMAAA